MRLILCLNCLGQDEVTPFPVGPEKGSQRDPYRETVDLCLVCSDTLIAGDFGTLASRNQTVVTIRIKSED